MDADPVFSRFSMTLGSTYLLSRADMGHAYMAQFICFVQGGYLAEINSQEEADFLQVNMVCWTRFSSNLLQLPVVF